MKLKLVDQIVALRGGGLPGERWNPQRAGE